MSETKPKFKQGEVVKLKSGGPLMTVTREPPSDICNQFYECYWFDRGDICSYSFPEAALLSGENRYTKPGGPDMSSG